MNSQSKEECKRNTFIQSLIQMDWKGIIAVIVFISPIFWVIIFSKTDERYLQLKIYQDNESRKTDIYTKDQSVLKETLSDIRSDQKEQRALIIEGIKDNRSKRDSN